MSETERRTVQEYGHPCRSRVGHWFRWVPSNFATLALAERRILDAVWERLDEKFVSIRNGTRQIRTVVMNPGGGGAPLVLVHGMGAGVGLWINNLESLAEGRPVYAFDVLGFGRSSRPSFSGDAERAEAEFVESIEEWRAAVGLERFVLLGHSLGGFLAASYAIRHPERVQHLILADPWGFPEKPDQTPAPRRGGRYGPGLLALVRLFVATFNPLAVIRAAGPWGPGLISRFRGDITGQFAHLFDDDTVAGYIYHCNAQTPSGEAGFKALSVPIAFAKLPMINRIATLAPEVPITLLYGSESWMDSATGERVQELRHDSHVRVQKISGIGHHVYADKTGAFNDAVKRVCNGVDRAPSGEM